MQLVVIVNEVAGHGKAQKRSAQITSELQIPYILEKTAYIGHATEIAAKYGETGEPTLLLTIGGDGTIHEVIKGATNYSNVTVAVINGGSGNDFGRAYKVFSTVQHIENYIAAQQFDFHDLGIVQRAKMEDFFMNNCGFGIDATVTNAVNHSKAKSFLNKFSLGKLAYAWILLKELINFKPFSLEITENGRQHRFDQCYFVVASNQPYFGGGMKISPNSKTNDGQLELTVVNNIPKWLLLLIFGTVFFGKHTKFKAVKQYAANSFELKIFDEVIGHADGEYIGMTENGEKISYAVKTEGWRLATNKLD